MSAPGWDDAETARYFEEFDRRHDRYRRVNEKLAERAELGPARTVLDVGAGLGGTARAALSRLPPDGRVVCVEPATALRERGKTLLGDLRVRWTDRLPAPPAAFDRVLCGASLWLVGPLDEAVGRVAALVAEGGALCFTIPSLYLGRPDDPGGGEDPHLLSLPGLLAAGRVPRAGPGEPLPTEEEVDQLLRAARLVPERWSVDLRLTQAAYRDWLKIPPLTQSLLPDVAPAERARLVDDAYARVDGSSWRWERWSGWTARKPAYASSATRAGT